MHPLFKRKVTASFIIPPLGYVFACLRLLPKEEEEEEEKVVVER